MGQDKITAKHIKTSLLCYYRYRRGFIVATEVSLGGGIADVLVDTGTEIHEVEVKVTKSDLLKEASSKKFKHIKLRTGYTEQRWSHGKWGLSTRPNRFYFAVPAELVEETRKFVQGLNSDYGIIKYTHGTCGLHEDRICIIRNAKVLVDYEPVEPRRLLVSRLCSEVCVFHKKALKQWEVDRDAK